MDSQYYTFSLPYDITTSTIRRAYKFCLQEKCEHYWPNQVNTSIKIGSEFTVTVVLYVPSAEYQIRKIRLKSVKNILSQIMDDDSLFFRAQIQSMNWL